MKIKRLWIIVILVSTLSLFLAACSALSQDRSAAAYAPSSTEASSTGDQDSADGKAAEASSSGVWDEQARLDEQGAIMVEITPLNLNDPGETLDFAVNLNTHSVDLSMDLAPLATLTTDSGLSVQALQWDAPSGGHHLSGTLSFPASLENTSLLSGAQKLTLILVDLDVPERVFIWQK